jgi:hypothetical protein
MIWSFDYYSKHPILQPSLKRIKEGTGRNFKTYSKGVQGFFVKPDRPKKLNRWMVILL